MNQKFLKYNSRKQCTRIKQDMILQKTNYWKSLFVGGEESLIDAVSLFTRDPIEQVAASSLDTTISSKVNDESDSLLLLEKFLDISEFELKEHQDSTLQFNSFLSRFICLAEKELFKHNIPSAIKKDYFKYLKQLIYQVSYQTLVLEINVARVQGQLEGNNAEERYAYFDEVILNDRNFLEGFIDEYTVLWHICTIKYKESIGYFLEILDHYYKDENIIQHTFYIKGDLCGVEFGLGDTHNFGKTVAMLTFESGERIVYKPRDLSVDESFSHLLDWLNIQLGGFELKTCNVINKSTYGWAEFIKYQPCKSEEEVKGYYYRLGKMLGILYSLDAVDFHHENLIAHGPFPILIDLESILHQHFGTRQYGDSSREYAAKILDRSVQATGILPFNLYFGNKGKNAPIDISGVGGAKEQKSPFTLLRLKNKSRDDIQMSHDYFNIEMEKNVPELNGATVNAITYLQDILSGFSDIYLFIKDHTKEYVDKLSLFKGCTTRIIARATSIYGNLLNKSYHPDFLRDMVDREVLLSKINIYKNHYDKKELLEVELAALVHGEIPYFTTSPEGTHLSSIYSKNITDFSQSVLQRVNQKVNSFSMNDLKEQKHIIRMSMLAAFNAEHEKDMIDVDLEEYSPLVVNQENYLDLANRIGNYLYENKITNTSEHDVTWISTIIEGSEELSWAIAPVGLDLYSGNAGIGLFMSYLSRTNPDDNVFKNVVIQCVNTIKKFLYEIQQNNNLLKDVGIGAFSGMAGSFYFLQHASVNQEKEEWLQLIYDNIHLLDKCVSTQYSVDIIDGTAGALMVLMSLYEQTESMIFIDVADKCVEHIMTKAKKMTVGLAWEDPDMKKFYTGFAHGTSGIISALARYNKVKKNKVVTEFIEEVILFENSMFDPVNQNWLTEGREAISVSWCHGAPGILLSRKLLIDYGLNSSTIQSDFKIALETTLKKGIGNTRTYCHGDMGQLEILRQCKVYEEDIINTTTNLEKFLYFSFKDNSFEKGSSRGIETAGMMIGIGGMGFGMLQAANLGYIPNILSLDPPLQSNKSVVKDSFLHSNLNI